MKKWYSKRSGLPLGDNLIVFYYISGSEIWPDKWGGSGLIRGGLLYIAKPDIPSKMVTKQRIKKNKNMDHVETENSKFDVK
jgi:hypothetical protein